MSHKDPAAKLVYMANQIGTFFVSQGPEEAITGTLAHIQKFWDPRVRSTIIAHLDKGGEGLKPNVKAAIEKLKADSALSR